MDLKKILKKAFDAGYDTSVMYNCGDGNAYEDFESFYRSEIKQLTLTDVGNCQFEAYATFCIECDRKGMKPLKYIDYLKIG